jgi:hypothetical protein
LLGAHDATTFLDSTLGDDMLHVAGPADRWADLFCWEDLNIALNQGLISYPRVRLMLNGTEVAPEFYTFERAGRRWPDSGLCQRLMSSGATLILVALEGINPRLEAFVRELEHDFRAHVRVDAVATCASMPGLKMHWDNTECFNIQIAGEKDWAVVRPERSYPLAATHAFPDRTDAVKCVAPETPPTWSGTIVPGDLIYLPRGWWHLVTPRVSPSLHLSIAADIPTFTDFFRWLTQGAAQHEVVRKLVPVWQSTAERQTRSAEALAVLRSLQSPDSLETYLGQLDDAAPSRPDFTLPSAASPGGTHLEPRTSVRLRSTRPLSWSLNDASLTLTWRGQSFRFSAQLLPALSKLTDMRAVTLEELSLGTNPLQTHAFVVALLTAGLLVVTARSADES